MGMKILRLIIISIISLFFVLTIISLFIPSDVRVAKIINIQTVADSVWPQLSDMRNWQHWYPGVKDTTGQDFFPLDSANGTVTKIRLNKMVISLDKRQDDELTATLEKGKRHNNMGWNVISYSLAEFVT